MSHGQKVLHVGRDRLTEVVKALGKDGYLSASTPAGWTTWATKPPAACPTASPPSASRSWSPHLPRRRERIRLRVQVPEPTTRPCPSLFDVHPGTEALEREVFDMFGITFDGHPDLTRILMPEDWDGHPLRKDYAVGASRCSSRAPRDRPVTHAVDPTTTAPTTASHLTAEGASEMEARAVAGGVEVLREVGAVLRLSEAEAAVLADRRPGRRRDHDHQHGPPAPVDPRGAAADARARGRDRGLRTKPIIGYLHTGMEKTGEDLTYLQGATNVTRMDYASPLFNELAFSLATEKLLGVEVPERATWIRMLHVRAQPDVSHLLFLATNGMDLGAVSMMLYGWREREEVLRFLEMVTGLRMNHNYIRPGGVAADLPDGWRDACSPRCSTRCPPPRRVRHPHDRPAHLARAPPGRRRDHHRRGARPRRHRARSCAPPATPGTCAATMPYLAYDEVDFDVVVGSYGDCFDRYAIRLNEIRESIRIVRQIIERMPEGDYRIQDKKVTPPPRARIDESMEALIHHFKIFTEGFKVPAGEAYVAVESPRGELGCYIVSDGSGEALPHAHPGPELRQPPDLPHMMHERPHRRRRRRHLLRRPDHGRGGPVSTLDRVDSLRREVARLPMRSVLVARLTPRTSSSPARSSPATRGRSRR